MSILTNIDDQLFEENLFFTNQLTHFCGDVDQLGGLAPPNFVNSQVVGWGTMIGAKRTNFDMFFWGLLSGRYCFDGLPTFFLFELLPN